jgi:hypothetical protein
MRTSQPTVAKLKTGSRMLLGALRFEAQDGLADFLVIREPGPFVGPPD